MQNNKLFVTGGSGFVGSQILNQLIQDGKSCIALTRNKPEKREGIEWIEGDLLDPATYENQLQKVDTIIHAAALVSYQRKDKNNLVNANYLATKELVNNALQNNVRNIIYVSSASTLIRSTDHLQISLKSTGIPVFNSWYAKTKFLGELEIWRAAAEGMNVCILYPSLVIGHGHWESGSMRVFDKVASGINYFPPGNLGLVAVEDLAMIVSRICNEGIHEQQILLNAEVWSYKDFLNEIARNLKLRPIQKEAYYWQAKGLSILDAVQSLWLSKKPLLTGEIIKSCFTKFNYQPNELDFKFQDIRKLIQEIVASQLRTLEMK